MDIITHIAFYVKYLTFTFGKVILLDTSMRNLTKSVCIDFVKYAL